MVYKKPQARVVELDSKGFMTWSGIGGASPGHSCNGTYTIGGSCSGYSWDSGMFAGGVCSNYDGHYCYAYTDSSHPNCKRYSISCKLF